MKISSNWSTASTARRSPGGRAVARRSSRAGCAPGRNSARRPAVAAREHAGGERRQQPGAQRRGLAAPRRADDREQRRAHQARDELRDELLAPEEVLGVVDVEGGEPLERADHGRPVVGRGEQLGALVGGLERRDAARQLGLERPRLLAARPPRGRRRRRRAARPPAAPTRSRARGRAAAPRRSRSSSVSAAARRA